MTPKSCIHIRQCHAACAALADQHQGLARAAGHRAAHLGEQHSQPGHRERAVMRRDGGLPDPGLPALRQCNGGLHPRTPHRRAAGAHAVRQERAHRGLWRHRQGACAQVCACGSQSALTEVCAMCSAPLPWVCAAGNVGLCIAAGTLMGCLVASLCVCSHWLLSR
jgi:hypothetical protein